MILTTKIALVTNNEVLVADPTDPTTPVVANTEVLKVLIQNLDYRNWRRDHNKGGDFILYSDIKEVERKLKIKLNP